MTDIEAQECEKRFGQWTDERLTDYLKDNECTLNEAEYIREELAYRERIKPYLPVATEEQISFLDDIPRTQAEPVPPAKHWHKKRTKDRQVTLTDLYRKQAKALLAAERRKP